MVVVDAGQHEQRRRARAHGVTVDADDEVGAAPHRGAELLERRRVKRRLALQQRDAPGPPHRIEQVRVVRADANRLLEHRAKQPLRRQLA